ncbi:16S rRNA (uracil(1498)-N(3))-methyltransferase [Ornithinimicrobium sp. W1665]|uniref:16S rRNA (uracil(1498)-N(3))-methyltransferase n=1 Tax=Ornithinimicrobium sp. W1665 TaxID=3416666 RepID=UPI003CF95CB6
MTAPLFVVGPELLTGDGAVLRLDGPEGRHAADVQRLGTGETLVLADGRGAWARCRVEEAHRGALDLVVLERGTDPAPPVRHVLVQALAKGDRDLQAVESATEMEVDEVVPWQADRSIVRWRGERAAKSHRRWEQQVLAAGKQARRTRLPVVAGLAGRTDLLARASAADLALVLHEEAEETLTAVLDGTDLTGSSGPLEVVVVVGPEGGITPEELTALRDAGARAVRLGGAVLRTSTAGAAALALLNARGRWR